MTLTALPDHAVWHLASQGDAAAKAELVKRGLAYSTTQQADDRRGRVIHWRERGAR